MIVVFSLPSVVIDIHSPALSVNTQVDLKKRLLTPTFNSCVAIPVCTRITSLRPFDNGLGHIVAVIRNMGVNMVPGLVIMGNHFPSVILAMIGETRTPMSVSSTPLGITRFRIILLKRVPNGGRNVMTALLRDQRAGCGQKDQNKEHYFVHDCGVFVRNTAQIMLGSRRSIQ